MMASLRLSYQLIEMGSLAERFSTTGDRLYISLADFEADPITEELGPSL
jgi:hypothetical protein